MRFKKVSQEIRHDETVDEYTLELRPGHTVSRVDRTSRLGAGRKGRAAEVTLVRQLACTCGGRVSYGGLTVAEDLANLRHFESEEERVSYEEGMEAKKAEILKALGLG